MSKPPPPPSGPMANGGLALVRTVMAAGVDTVFTLHGAHVDVIFQAAVDEGLRIVDHRHEAAAGHAAEAYARVRRGLGFAVVTAGAGFTNLVSSMANAFTDRTPVLYIAGAPSLGEAETNTLQGGIDQVAMATPVTKWAHQINRPQDVARLVAHAIRIATTAPMGPVFLNIPIDVGLTPFPLDTLHIADNLIVDTLRLPPPDSVAAIRNALAEAERPIVLVGSEAWYDGSGPALSAFAETHGVPVFSDFAAHGLIPADHRLYGGTGHKLAYVGDARPDLVLALGTRFGLFTLGEAALLFPSQAKVVHVTLDGPEIGRVRRADIAVTASPRAVLEALNATPATMRTPSVAAWAAAVGVARPARLAELDDAAENHAGPIHPWRVVRAVAAAARDHILVADGAEAYHWLNDAMAQQTPGAYLTHGHLGCMGIGFGLSIGAQAARPDRRVILMTGDGAAGFNIAEFDTLVKHGLPVVVVVMKNCSWGASQRFQEVFPMARHIVGTTLPDTDYAAIARGFGADGVSITQIADFAPALDAALASGRTTCIDVRVDFAPPSPELTLMMSQPQ